MRWESNKQHDNFESRYKIVLATMNENKLIIFHPLPVKGMRHMSHREKRSKVMRKLSMGKLKVTSKFKGWTTACL
jgi:hypothetical protein